MVNQVRYTEHGIDAVEGMLKAGPLDSGLVGWIRMFMLVGLACGFVLMKVLFFPTAILMCRCWTD